MVHDYDYVHAICIIITASLNIACSITKARLSYNYGVYTHVHTIRLVIETCLGSVCLSMIARLPYIV